MKTTLISIIFLFTAMQLFGQSDSFKLPAEWDKNFVISISHTGSMSGNSSHFTFTHDSCSYNSNSRKGQKNKKFALSPADRGRILTKMKVLNVESIKEGFSIKVQDDGWSDVLCFGMHCFEGGSGSEMSPADKEIFLTAAGWLEEFAISK